MAVADSMFMFEIVVEELKSLVNCKEFCIKSQFADIFSIHLDDPNEYKSRFLPKRGKKTARKIKQRRSSTSMRTSGQSILFANNVESLVSSMKQYPMELSLWSKIIPDYKIGSTHIAWSSPYFEYLNKLHKKQDSVCVKGEYNVFDEVTSRRMAIIKLNIKLRYVKGTDISQLKNVTPEKQEHVVSTGFNSKCTITDITSNSTKTGMVKAFYKGEKRKVKKDSRYKQAKKAEFRAIQKTDNKAQKEDIETVAVNSTTDRRLNSRIVSLVRSDPNLKNNNSSVIKSKSCSNIIQENKILNYIFGGKPAGPFGNQVYCVGYFTVQNDFADSPKSAPSDKTSEKSVSRKGSPVKSGSPSPSTSNRSDQSDQTAPKEKYKFRICDIDCPGKKLRNLPGALSECSLDLPKEASHLITLTKCDRVDCDGKKTRQPRTPPDDAVYLDLGDTRDCCDISQKVEEVVGGMRAKMKFGDEPCYCECECKFGFMKKTTFCKICGGYEIFGEEYPKIPRSELPFPCPIFHNLVDKNKIGTSGSDTKREKKEFAEAKKEKKEVTDPIKDRKDKTEIKKDRKDKSEAKSKDKKEGMEGNEPKKDKRKIPKPKTTVLERKSSDSDREPVKKSKKSKKDSRFKFNYGYQAPKIGHSRCMLPCDGTITTMNAVPKRMGWLWNAENVLGMKVKQGWRPGAISNQLLKQLNKVRMETHPVEKAKPTKKTKKRIVDKPTLIICKRRGEYRVEMQVSPEDSEMNIDHCSPLIYRISREDNEERIEKRLRKRHRLIKKAVDEVWEDPYHPEVCEKSCLKAYKQAIGQSDYSPECNCSEEEQDDESCSCCDGEDDDTSDASSLDLEWEIHFSPPIASQS
ncbi:uncharacterized protein LOC118266748 isoform X4 [Spodoptera frugiperda]|uniref:Uncharacterized protein LOC118266748 isoform X4 n=1 Tax=Spodoptera frugiperda TaxID=7108 RepID=A0A9R0F1Y7_SPOFR|nr:uncharacterized protein LOC118266748 isoform X4 [Spodoptera frugiperda]